MFRLIRFLMNAAFLLLILYIAGQAFLDHVFESNIGAKVRIGSVRLHLNPAEIEVRRIRISNLKGFSEPYLAILPEVFIRVNLPDLLKGRTHIELMRINLEEIRVEYNSAGQVNLNELRKILSQKQAAQAKSGVSRAPQSQSQAQAISSQTAKPVSQVKIDRAVLSLGKAVYADTSKKPAYRKEFALNVREQKLDNAEDPLALTQQIITAILSRAGASLAGAKFDQWGAQVGAQTGELLENAKKSLQDFFK